MTVVALLEELASRGIAVTTDGNRLRLRPAAAVSSDLVQRVKEHKAELLALLRLREDQTSVAPVTPLQSMADTPPWAAPPTITADPASPWPPALAFLGGRTVGAFTSCLWCGVGTWVSYAAVPTCLTCARSWPADRTPEAAREGARGMLWALLGLWATLGEARWTATEVMLLKNQIVAFWMDWPDDAQAWWTEWRAAHPGARLV